MIRHSLFLRALFVRALLSATVLLALSTAHARAQVCTAMSTMVAFGSYDPTSPMPTDSIGSVTVACSGAGAQTASYRIMLARPGTARQLAGAGEAADYQLYLDAAHTQVWGDCTGGTSCATGTLVLGRSTVRRVYPIYARMPAHQRVGPGGLADTVLVTLSY